MTFEERLEIFKQNFEEITDIGETKGKAYAGTADTLSNFKRNAERRGLDVYSLWAVYAFKHIDCIDNSIKAFKESLRDVHYEFSFPVDKTESLHGRIKDALVYFNLLDCLIREEIYNADIIDQFEVMYQEHFGRPAPQEERNKWLKNHNK